MLVVLRSQRGDGVRESCFSLSPCSKNSSIILAVHREWISHGLVGLETSAVCSNKPKTLDRCSSVSWTTLWDKFQGGLDSTLYYSTYVSEADKIDFISARSSKWADISVARTMSITSARTLVKSSELRPCKMFVSSYRENIHVMIHKEIGCDCPKIISYIPYHMSASVQHNIARENEWLWIMRGC